MLMTAMMAFAGSAFAQQPTLESGIKMYRYKKYQSAQKILLPLSVKDPVANYYLGLSYLEQGNIAKANYQFQKFPEDPANISGAARVTIANKDVTGGTQAAKDLAAKAKKKETVQLVYAAEALTYSEGTDYQQAIQWYKDALAKNANDVEAHLGLGDTYRKITGGGGEAMNNYEWITEKEPNNSLVLTRIGDLWYDARNYQSALEFYGKAKAADSTNPLPYKSLSLAYQRTGKYELALTNIRKYLELSDNTIDEQINFVEILYQAKGYCEAAKTANELLNQNPPTEKRTTLIGISGFSQAECGDSVEAQRLLREYFATQKPKYITPGAYIAYGKLWMKLNNLDSASFYYNKGIAGDTAQNKTEIYRTIAEAYKSKKEYLKAGEWYDNLIKSNPNTQALDYFWWTVMNFYGKDYKTALTAAESFEKKYADQPSSTYWHARVLSAIDSEAVSGTAAPLFEKWLQTLGEENMKKPEKKKDVTMALEYLVLYNYKKEDKATMQTYKDKLLMIDPKNALVEQLSNSGGAKAPAPKEQKPKTQPKAK